MSIYLNNIISRIKENIGTTPHTGIIIASPSSEPDYKYHWIRDSALVMRPFLYRYETTRSSEYFKFIMDYLEVESKLQDLSGKSGLGEPKFEIDCTPYMEEWGRPQNDGPALRGLVLIRIIHAFKHEYDVIIKNLILPMLLKDLEYICDNYNKPSFDLWEEKYGWHWYTRMVQWKFIKESKKIIHYLDKHIQLDTLNQVSDGLISGLKDHINGNSIISSFDINGEISKYEDAANILGYCHIDFDREFLEIFPIGLLNHTVVNLIDFFRSKYNMKDINYIGRYQEDVYYGGQIWIICTLAVAQYYSYLYQTNKNYEHLEISHKILEKILTLDENLILPEQFDPRDNTYYSAKKLTWNYSELFVLIINLIF